MRSRTTALRLSNAGGSESSLAASAFCCFRHAQYSVFPTDSASYNTALTRSAWESFIQASATNRIHSGSCSSFSPSDM